jgi:DNA-binding beta-propeller fold protein YncE
MPDPALAPRGVVCALVALIALTAIVAGQDAARPPPSRRVPGRQPGGEILLPNQWSLRPVGQQVVVGEGPMNCALHPTQPYAVLLHAGQNKHGLTVIDLPAHRVVSFTQLPQCFQGITFSGDGKHVYASGGEHEVVHEFDFENGELFHHRELRVVPVDQKFVVAGLASSPDGATLYACGAWGGGIVALDPEGKRDAKVADVGRDTYPYGVLPSPDGKRLYVSLWGAQAVAVLDARSLERTATWATPSHPTEMRLSNDARTLYVACANANRVAVLDVDTGHTLEVIDTALYPGAPNGSTSLSLDLSVDGTLLAVANADNNNVAVFNVSEPGKARSLGFIPVGWYASSVRFRADNSLCVSSAKGIMPKSNRHGPDPNRPVPADLVEYIAGLYDGTLSLVPPLTPERLAKWTADALASSPLRPDASVGAAGRDADNPVPGAVGAGADVSPIKHVLYIIKENRTYDQVFGDMPEGNGDPSLCIFPEKVTPNLHALAREFVLLDNFYVESEVSADGHEWSTGAYATDFVEKSWPLSYRTNRPKNHEKVEYPAEGEFDIAVPAGGYLWDQAAKAGITYRNYGEWVREGKTANDPGTPKAKALEGHIDPMFRPFDMNYSDLDRAERFIGELKRFEAGGDMPRLQVMHLPNDHTSGTSKGKPTPAAYVAQNDRALGMIVDAVSHSNFWNDTAIFVVEDDAQNGSDHVDAHRTEALVISPYTRRGAVDSTLYSTTSMLRTIGLILGTPPMSQFDAAAQPMYASFTAKPTLTPYDLRPARIDLGAKNLASAWGADRSDHLDFSREDAADDIVLNEIIWRSVRGPDSPMPAPVRAAFVFQIAAANGDKDDHDDGDDDDK